MAKKTLTKKRKGLFDEFVKVKTVRQGESLRFRDKNGRLVKFDARKKLIAEIWVGNKRTNRVLNKTSKKQPIPQKFNARRTRQQLLFLEDARKGRRSTAEVKYKKIKINAHQTIVDNLEAKIPEIAEDTVKYSKRGNGSYISLDVSLVRTYIDTDGEETDEVFRVHSTFVVKSTKRQYVFDEIARRIINILYKNDRRASNKLDSHKPDSEYVRSFEVSFYWQETKRLSDM